MDCTQVKFQQRGDERGSLIVIESKKDVPFSIERVFYMIDTDPSTPRGMHANRNSDFVLINIQGSVKVKTFDGKHEHNYELNRKDEGLYIPRMIWKEMYEFSPDAILLVLSNQHYQENEYIRDFDDYKKEVHTL